MNSKNKAALVILLVCILLVAFLFIVTFDPEAGKALYQTQQAGTLRASFQGTLTAMILEKP